MMVQMISENQSEIHALQQDLSAQTDSRRTYQERNKELQSYNQSLKNELVRFSQDSPCLKSNQSVLIVNNAEQESIRRGAC